MRHNRPEVRVVTRFKPLSEEEKSHNKNKKISPMCVVFDQQNIEVLDRMHQAGAPPSAEFEKGRGRSGSINEMAKNFTMDEVFSDMTTQAEIYERVGRPIVKNVVKGYNGTVLAYGQTGSGKTHSMIGPEGGSVEVFSPDAPHYKMRGMIPRMVEELFRRLKTIHRSERTWNVSVSIFEIYKEEIIDLLAPSNSNSLNNSNKEKYRIREDVVKGQGIYIESLERPEAQSAEEVISLIRYAANKRKTAVTNINETSSRSHSLVVIYLEQMDYTGDPHGQRISSRLNLVDLAGSEKVYKTLADGERLQEAKKINLSLTLLGNVIYKLTDGKSGYVPYRDSKLTRILQESLGGNSITTLVCHCSIAMYNREETLSTLRFAQRAKRVRNKPQINKDLSAKELKLQLIAAEQKIESLENKLRVKSDIIARQRDSKNDRENELLAMIDSLTREIEQLREELALKEEELEHEKDRAELYKREAAALAAELEKERKRNAKQQELMEEALKDAQEDNDKLRAQLAELKEELAKPQYLNLTPRKEAPPALTAEEEAAKRRKEQQAVEEQQTPSIAVTAPVTPPKRAASAAPFERQRSGTGGQTVEGQIRKNSFMLGRPTTALDGSMENGGLLAKENNYLEGDGDANDNGKSRGTTNEGEAAPGRSIGANGKQGGQQGQGQDGRPTSDVLHALEFEAEHDEDDDAFGGSNGDGEKNHDASGSGLGNNGKKKKNGPLALLAGEEYGAGVGPHGHGGKVCPSCGYHYPAGPNTDAETNTEPLEYLLAMYGHGAEGVPPLLLTDGAPRNGVLGASENASGRVNGGSHSNTPLRQLGNDEVSRSLQAAGQVINAIANGTGPFAAGQEGGNVNTNTDADMDTNGATTSSERTPNSKNASNQHVGNGHGDGLHHDGEREGTGVFRNDTEKAVDKTPSRLSANPEVLGAVALLEQVLHVIADAIENDQFRVPTPNSTASGTEEEKAAAHQELKDALKMSERVLAAWRESEGALNPEDLVEQEKQKKVPLRLLSKPERAAFKAHEKELAASELDGIQRRLQRQAVAEELATADKGNMLGRQDLRSAAAEEQQQAKDELATLPEKLFATAEEAAAAGSKHEDGRPRTANPAQQDMLKKCFEKLAKALGDNVAKSDDLLADNLYRQLRKDTNANAGHHAEEMGKALEHLTDKIAQHCDDVLNNELNKNEPIDAATFDKLNVELKKTANKDIKDMYRRARDAAGKDHEASMAELRAEAKKENEQMRQNLNDLVDAEVQKMALQLQTAREEGEAEMSPEEIRELCRTVAEKAKEEVDRLAARHLTAVEEHLKDLDKEQSKFLDEEMAAREAEMKKNVEDEIGQMVAKMQVLAMHEQMAPTGNAAPMNKSQLAQLTEQLKLISKPDIQLSCDVTPSKEKRQDWMEAERPRMVEPIKQLSDKILHASEACAEKAKDKYAATAHEAVENVADVYQGDMDTTARKLPTLLATAHEEEFQNLSPEQSKEVAKALKNLSETMRAMDKEAKKQMATDMNKLADEELEEARKEHDALSAKEADQLAATLSTASAAYWGDLLSDDAGTLEDFTRKLQNLSAEEIEDMCAAHRDLSEEQQKALAQQLQRLYAKDQQKAHQNLAAEVEKKMDDLADRLHALRNEEEAAGRVQPGDGSLSHEDIDKVCEQMKLEAMEEVAATEKKDRELAAEEFARMAKQQAVQAEEEQGAMQTALEVVAQRDLAKLQDRLGNLMVQSMTAAEQRPNISQQAFTPEKLKALTDNINVLIAHESEDPYGNSLRSLVSQQLKDTAKEEADRFYAESTQVAAAQHDKTLKSSDAQCAKDVRVLAQRQVAMGEDDMDELPDKLSVLVGAEVGEALTPAQMRMVHESMNELAEAMQALFQEERRDLDEKLEALTSRENQMAAERHNSLTRADLKNLSGDVSRKLEGNFQQLIDNQEPITPRVVELVVAQLQEMCNSDIAALCEKHGRLSESETRDLEMKINDCCAKDAHVERGRVEDLIQSQIDNICHALEGLQGDEAFSPEQIERLRDKMNKLAAEEIGQHYDKKGAMSAEEAGAIAAHLGDLHAKSNVELMERLQACAGDNVEKMTSAVAHAILTAEEDGAFEQVTVSPNNGLIGNGVYGSASSAQRGQSPSPARSEGGVRVKPNVARAVVNELIAEEVANCLKESQMNAQEYAILAEQIMDLSSKNKRDLADHIRRTSKTAEEREAAGQPMTPSMALVAYTQPVTRQQYSQLSHQIEKLADLDARRSDVKNVSPRVLERLSNNIQQLSRPEFELLRKRLEVQAIEQTPREEVHNNTAEALNALVEYISSIDSSDKDSLTNALVQSNIDPSTLNRILRILGEASGYQANPPMTDAAVGSSPFPRRLHSYESTSVGLANTESRGTSPHRSAATLHQWSERMQHLCDTIEGAAVEEVEPAARRPSGSPAKRLTTLSIEDREREPVLLLRDYSEGRMDASGCPLAFMSPLMTHRAELVEQSRPREPSLAAGAGLSAEENVEEAKVLSDMNALQAAETVMRRNLAAATSGEEVNGNSAGVDMDEVTAAATTVERVIQRASTRRPLSEENRKAIEAVEHMEAVDGPFEDEEERREALLAKLRELHDEEGKDVVPAFFDTLVQEYLQQSDEVQNALDLIHSSSEADQSFSKNQLHEKLNALAVARQEEVALYGNNPPNKNDAMANKREMLQSMQVVADAVAVVLDKQREQILIAFEEEEEFNLGTERGLTATEANRVLWATQNLGAAMQAEETSPSVNTGRVDNFPRQIQSASVAMRCLVNEAMVEPRTIEATMTESGILRAQSLEAREEEEEDPVWRLLQREDVREAVRAFDSQAKAGGSGERGDVPLILKDNSLEKATVPVVHALKLPSSFSERSQHMRGGLSVLDYGLSNVEGKQRVQVGRPQEHTLIHEVLPTARDPTKKVLTRYGYAKATRECGTMTDIVGKEGYTGLPSSSSLAEQQRLQKQVQQQQQQLQQLLAEKLLQAEQPQSTVDEPQAKETLRELLWCMGVPEEEIHAVEEQPDAVTSGLQRLRHEVMFMKKAEEPSLRREIEARHRELACIYDAMAEMIEVVRRTSVDAAERNDVFAQRLTARAKGTMADKLRDKVNNSPNLSSSTTSDLVSATSSSKRGVVVVDDDGSATAPPRPSGLSQRPHVNAPAPIPTKAMLSDGTFDERMNRRPTPVELQTLTTLDALSRSAQTESPANEVNIVTPHQSKATKAPKEVAMALRETTTWMDEFQVQYYELMKRYLESFSRAERLDELLDKSRNERDDSKQELDALKLVLDSMRKENQSMKEVLEENNVDLETYLSSLEHQKRVNARLAKQTETLKTQAEVLATTADQQEFCEMGSIELAIRGEEMEEIEKALEDVQNFYDPDLIAKKRKHLGKGIRSIGTFCQKILSMCQARPRFNTGTLESQRLNLLQGTAELYNRYEWAKEELNEQLERQRAGVAR